MPITRPCSAPSGASVYSSKGCGAMALLRRYNLDAAVALLVAIPVHKLGKPEAGLLLSAEFISRFASP